MKKRVVGKLGRLARLRLGKLNLTIVKKGRLGNKSESTLMFSAVFLVYHGSVPHGLRSGVRVHNLH